MFDIKEEKNKKLLEDALAKYGIDAPKSYKFDDHGYVKWGNFNRCWIKLFGHFILFGNYDAKISSFVTEIALTDTYKNLINEETRRTEEIFKNRDEFFSKDASNTWKIIEKSGASHPYILNNNIKVYNLKQSGDNLIIPLYDTTEKIWNLQSIDDSGNKKFLYDGKKHGCYFIRCNSWSNNT